MMGKVLYCAHSNVAMGLRKISEYDEEDLIKIPYCPVSNGANESCGLAGVV